MGVDSDSTSTLNSVSTVDEEKEGVTVESSDYFFEKIGEAIPVEPNGSLFNLQNPPSVPLAVSERFNAIFVAHSTGFCVAKTHDILTSAKELKKGGGSCSILELSIVNISIGRAYILALSSESSTLAVSVVGDVYFFSVKSLLAQDPVPLFSCSLGPTPVKDICWNKQRESSFLILSRGNCLYRGTLHESLVQVMDDVDAVEWSVNKQYIAVARKNVLSIVSPELKERHRISLELKLDVHDFNNLRVDSIRWVRPDCIILGCFEQTLDGREGNYLVRAVMCRNGEDITNASSTLVVVCFQDLFLCIADDIMPPGFGPYLMTSYLERCQLAVVAHRKNTDQHIMLIRWPQGGDEPAVVDIERDTWLPRIELQENGDENLVLSLCVSQASGSETVQVRVGNDELTELSPDVILFCLTHEGKLTMFYFASVSNDEDAKTANFISSAIPAVCASPKDVDAEKLALELHSRDLCKSEDGSDVHDEVFNQKESHVSNSESSVSDYKTSTGESITRQKEECLLNKSILKAENHLEMSTEKDGKLGGLESDRNLSLVNVGASFDPAIHRKSASTQRVKCSRQQGNEVTEHCQPTSLNFSLNELDSKNASVIPSSFHLPVPYPNAHGCSNVKKLEGNACENTGVAASSVSLPITSSASIPDSVGRGYPMLTGISKISSDIHSTRFPSRSPVLGKPSSIYPSSLQHPSKPSVSTQYGNMKDMARELDLLLDSIEVESFRETCSDLRNNLEEELKAICDGSSTLQSITGEQLEMTQHLLRDTVQVLARKTNMEGIVKQTTDKQYLDVWDRQKLTSELELKRQNIMLTSQDMISQLVELENYLNALEISSYGVNNRVKTGRQFLQNRAASSRQHQSVHAVCNAMSSQLASAELLSECLSRQMSVLSISSSAAKVCIKDQLFEMIGIAHEGDTQGSSNTRQVTDASENTPVSVLSPSPVVKVQRRSQEYARHHHEPETARRRRESLDRSWSNFEPSRTSIKRILERDEPAVRSPLSTGTKDGLKNVSPGRLPSSFVTQKKDIPRPLLSGSEQTSAKQIVEDGYSKPFSFHSSSKLAPHIDLGVKKDTPQPFGTRSKTNSISCLESFEIKGKHAGVQSEPQTSQSIPSYGSASGFVSSFLRDSTESASDSSDMSSVLKAGGATMKTPAHDSFVSAPLETLAHMAIPSRNYFGGVSTSSLPSSSSVSVSSPAISFTSSISSPALGRTPMTPNANESLPYGFKGLDTETKFTQSTAWASVDYLASDSKNSIISKSDSSSVTSSPLPSFVRSTSQSMEDHQSHADKSDATISVATSESREIVSPSRLKSPTDVTSRTEYGTLSPNKSGGKSLGKSSDLKLGSEVMSSEVPSGQASSSSEFTCKTDMNSSLTLGSRADEQSGGNQFSDYGPAQVSEDQMEEEEISNTADLNLGSLDGLGMGSGSSPPVSTAFKQNPFGGSAVGFSTSNSGPTSSVPTSMTVPAGEIFRPASFSFQPWQSQPANANAVSGNVSSGGFNLASGALVGPPSGIQALGSVLGSFGQSRQLGGGGTVHSSFGGAPAGGGFGGVSATGGGFAGAGGGFARAGGGSGGFAGIGGGCGGFGSSIISNNTGGFAAAASGGGGFGAFGSSNKGENAFSAFGGGGVKPPSELFTQMRK